MIHPAFQCPQPDPNAALIGSFICSRDDMTARGGLLGGEMIMIQQTKTPSLSHRAAPRTSFAPH